MANERIKLPFKENLTRIINIVLGIFASQDGKINQTLEDAKQYTDEEIEKLNISDAIIVDDKPVYDDSGAVPVVNYIKNGVPKTTENIKTWFFYYVAAENKHYQTLFINGEEMTLAVNNTIIFDDYVQKTDIVDNLVSTDIDKPLSANQGKELEDNKLDNTTDVANAEKYLSVSGTGKIVFRDLPEKFVTKDEYEALPATKLTDGIKYYVD